MPVNNSPISYVAKNVPSTLSMAELNKRDYKEVLDPAKVEEKLAKSFERAQTQKPTREVVDLTAKFAQNKTPAADEKELDAGAFEVGVEVAKNFVKDFTVDFTSPSEGVGTAWTQGRRQEMEDAHLTTHIEFFGESILVSGIFDGHDNEKAAKFSAENFAERFKARLEEKGSLDDVAVWNALKLAVVDLHRLYPSKVGGTTANISCKIGEELWIANLGDARALIVTKEGVEQLSEDAKPDIEHYKKSIEKRGGKVDKGRVQGKIGPARFTGNHKHGAVSSPRPKNTKVTIPQGAILVQGCDGLFDVSKTEDVGAYARELREQGYTPARCAAELTRIALETGSTDNISVTVTYM